jgi:hypothetical protein
MTDRQRACITSHGRCLLAIFPEATDKDPVSLCKKLRRLETQAHAIGLQMCNGPEMTEEEIEIREQRVLNRLDELLFWRSASVPVFVNKDPRGYALKIDDEWLRDQREHNKLPLGEALRALHQDWGGYGIIAPEIE